MKSKKWLKVLIGIVAGIGVLAIGGCLAWKGITSIRYVGVASTDIWQEEAAYDKTQVPKIVKQDGVPLKILMFSDIQLEIHPFNDPKTLQMVDDLVKEVQPDFIVTGGDNVSWIFADVVTKRLVEQMGSYGIPWGVTFGNHENDEGRADRNWIGNQYEGAPNSVFDMGPSNIHGVGNYHVNVEDEAGNILYTLVMLDSHDRRQYETEKDYDFIYYDQIKWYEWLIKGVSESQYGTYDAASGKVVPSMLFFHIPLPEFREAQAYAEANQVGVGKNQENVYCPPVNSGLFDRAKALGSTTHIFAAHDHVNNLSVSYEDILLTYGMKTGFNSYSDEEMRGATLIEIGEDGAVKVEHLYR